MKNLSNKKIIVGVVALMLATLFVFLFSRGEKRTPLTVKSSDESVIDEEREVDSLVNAEVPIEEEEITKEASLDSVNTKKNEDDKPEVVLEKTVEKNASTEKIVADLVSWGYQKADKRSIDTVIIHSSYDAIGKNPYSYSGILKEYKDAGVSPHYIIDREGKIYRLVEDKNIAYHAGESKMPDGRTGVNAFSVGIELMNTKTDKCTNSQYSSLKYLLGYLKGKYSIKNVLGHDDIAPSRKDDPWNFDWSRLK